MLTSPEQFLPQQEVEVSDLPLIETYRNSLYATIDELLHERYVDMTPQHPQYPMYLRMRSRLLTEVNGCINALWQEDPSLDILLAAVRQAIEPILHPQKKPQTWKPRSRVEVPRVYRTHHRAG